jgi:hypothetical protein
MKERPILFSGSCAAITRSGARCSRHPFFGVLYCKQYYWKRQRSGILPTTVLCGDASLLIPKDARFSLQASIDYFAKAITGFDLAGFTLTINYPDGIA